MALQWPASARGDLSIDAEKAVLMDDVLKQGLFYEAGDSPETVGSAGLLL